MIAIQVTQLSRELAGVQAVENLNLEASFGKILGLLGPNGAGKTTTLRVLAGLLAPSSGSIEICGKRIPEDLAAIKSKIGFLTYGMKLYPELSAIENLEFFGRIRNLRKAHLKSRIQQLIADFAMEGFCRKRFEKLSSGEKQKATIANTLLHDPEILILDEITLSLDIMSSAFIMEFIKKEKERGKCILFSTHVMSEAEYLCDEIAFIFKGSIIDQGSSPELMTRYSCSNLTATFLAAVQKANNRVPR